MTDDRDISKFLSYALRHAPHDIGLTLDAGGWAEVDALLRLTPFPMTRDDLIRVVETSDKRRFALSPEGTRLRANQGHSIPVDLGLVPRDPPETLFHGTHVLALESILTEGLRPMGRQHVHLSRDHATARTVGGRRGKPVVLTVRAGQMARDGWAFYRADNGVWLTDHVPPAYLPTGPARGPV